MTLYVGSSSRDRPFRDRWESFITSTEEDGFWGHQQGKLDWRDSGFRPGDLSIWLKFNARQDFLLNTIAKTCRVVVVSVDYRLAPEHPFPAAQEDCYDVAHWLVANGEKTVRKWFDDRSQPFKP
jgi:hypothetical protein